jgi:hypothetical protein
MYLNTQAQACASGSVDPNAVDLSNVWNMSFTLYKPGRFPTQVRTYGTIVVTDKTNGVVQYQWSPLDNQCYGLFYGQFTFNFRDGTILKFPQQMESLAIEVL